MLRGPADADQFRVKVGRYNDRWYHDPLPGCDIAPAWDGEVPSTSIVKNAWPKFLTNWAAGEAAACAVRDLHIWQPMAQPAAITYIAKAHDRSRDGAASRGSAVHRILEAFSLGQEPSQLDVLEAGDWVPACKQLIADLQPEWLLSEAVMIARGLGVGGTCDAGWRIDGGNYIIDFKSRGLDKDGKGKHDVYPDEAAQLGSYAGSDYMIVEEGGRATRRRLPDFKAGLIITIAPDGYRLNPVDLGQAKTLFVALRQFWGAMQECKPVGKPVRLGSAAPAPAAATPPAASAPTVDLFAGAPAQRTDPTLDPSALRADLEARAKVVMGYPDGVPTLGKELAARGLGKLSATADEQLPLWLLAVKDAESELRVPWPEEPLPEPKEPVKDDDAPVTTPAATVVGLPATDPAITAIIERCKALPSDLFAAVEANTVGAGRCPNLISGRATQADLALVEEQVALAEGEWERRKAYIGSLLGAFDNQEVLAIISETVSGEAHLNTLTEGDVERIERLVNAIDLLVIAFDFEGTAPTLVSTDKAESTLTTAHGSKSAALSAAKAAASLHGRPAPRSVAAAAADPLVVAAALPLTDPNNQTTQHERQSA